MLFTGSPNYKYQIVVDIFNAMTGKWSTANLSAARWWLAATSLPNQGLAIFAGGQSTSRVDIFNAITGVWSIATLSVGRYTLAATSLPNQGLAIFAGGQSKSRDCFVAVIAGSPACARGMHEIHVGEECDVLNAL
jgi:hypothetical protein